MSINLKTSFKNKVALPLTLALSIAASPMAMAESPSSASSHSASSSSVSHSAPVKKALTSGELAGRAQDWSIKNPDAIGFFLNIAPNSRYKSDPKGLGTNIRKMFANDGFRSNFTYSFAKAGQTSISFFVNGIAYAGYGMDEMETGYNNVLKHAQHIRDTDKIASQLLTYQND